MPKNKIIPLPLGKLIEEDANIYEFTSATIHRASQLIITGHEDVDAHGGKVISAAINQMVNKKFQYKFEDN